MLVAFKSGLPFPLVKLARKVTSPGFAPVGGIVGLKSKPPAPVAETSRLVAELAHDGTFTSNGTMPRGGTVIVAGFCGLNATVGASPLVCRTNCNCQLTNCAALVT